MRLRGKSPRRRRAERAAKALGAVAGLAALHKAKDKLELLQVKKKAQKLGVGDERLDPKK